MSTDGRMQPLGGDPGVRHPARTRAGRHQATPRRGGPRPVARRRLRRDPIALPPRKPQISPPVLIAAMPSDRRWLPPPPLRPDRPRRPTLPRTRHHRQSTHGHRAPSRVAPSRVALSRVAPGSSGCAVSGCAVSGCAVSGCAVSGCAVSGCARLLGLRRLGLRCLGLRQAPRVGALRVGAAGVGALRVGALRAQAPQSAGRSSQNPPTTAGLQRPVTREWTSLRGLRPAASGTAGSIGGAEVDGGGDESGSGTGSTVVSSAAGRAAASPVSGRGAVGCVVAATGSVKDCAGFERPRRAPQ